MKIKKIIIGMLLITIFMTQINIIPFSNCVYAEGTQNVNSTKFHYQQLNEVAKRVYEGIYEMYVQGILKTGTESFDLAKDDKYVSQEQLENYMKGNQELRQAMNAARYAFYADYPEVFYVNFQILTLRVTKDSENRYHANIGSGNLKSYYVDGFTDKEQVEKEIEAFNIRVNEIVEGATSLKVVEGQNRVLEQIKYIHNEIINNTSYRLESDCTEGNEGFLGTPYGALVKKQAVCEGYARSFKTILDKLGINCILVQGIHQSEGSAAVPHMWNYVQIEKDTNARAIEKVWYAVDCTLDDPFLRNTNMDTTDPDFIPGSDIKEGFENTRWCMLGKESMNREHVALENVEAAGNYKFEYPELEEEDYGIDYITNVNGLLVKFKQDGTETQEYRAGDFYVSYNGKGYANAREEGKYVLMKYHEYRPGDDIWLEGNWGYMNPELYAPGAFTDNGDHIYISVPNSEYVEFAVTTLAPSEGLAGYTYQGDESDFVAQSGKLYNPNGIYKARPYIKTQTPISTATLSVGPTYHVDVTYDDDLVLQEGAKQIGYKMESTGPTGAVETEITNFNFDGKRRITFDLKFSKMWADDGAMYTIVLTGVVGKNSGKEPMEIKYGAVHDIQCASRMNQAKNWELFARPQLLENEDLSMKDWQTKDGTHISDKLKNRIALVTTRTTTSQTEEMNNLLETTYPDEEIITSQTYNITLNACKLYVVKTGHRLRLSLGFPAGYGPDDAGTTFKAYHFIKKDDGTMEVEEIPCVVTQYGLIVTCDSFSPFAIAQVKADPEKQNTDKNVIVSSTEGGIIDGANREEGNIFTLKENEARTLTITPEDGYEIETVTVGGQTKEITNKEKMEVVVSYNDITDGNNIVNVNFVAKTVVQQEEEKGETVVEPVVTPAVIDAMPENVTAVETGDLTIAPIVTTYEGTHSYQWYKDGKPLNGQTQSSLLIKNVTKDDIGEYSVTVTTTMDTLSESVTSSVCKVTVATASFKTTISRTSEEELIPGSEFEVNVNVSNFQNVEKGINTILGQLNYDKTVLDMVNIRTQEHGWIFDENSLNEENLKFATVSDTFINQDSNVFTVKFKVKETISREQSTVVEVKNVVASNSIIDIASSDTQLKIDIKIPKIPEVPDEITSDLYTIEEGFVSRIAANTTVSSFKANVVTQPKEIMIKDKEGNILGDNDIVATGMTLEVGKLKFTLIVTGDIDGNGKLGATDLAKIKLHLIESEELTGILLKAADMNGDGKISATDLAQMKLALID